MLNSPKLYCTANLQRAKCAQWAILALAVLVSIYFASTTFSAIRQVWKTERLLSAARVDSARLSREAAALKNEESSRPALHNGGVDVFALQISKWAADQNVSIEAVTPQGAPVSSEISIGNTSLGAWDAVNVRVEGRGDYFRVMKLLAQLRRPDMPVKLESFGLHSDAGVDSNNIQFDLVLTVYERNIKSG